jgi:hypothetical protein
MTCYPLLACGLLLALFSCALASAEELGPILPVVGTEGGPVVRESTEWAQINCFGDNDPKTPRVLLIGDSISVQYSGVVRDGLKGKYLVDNLGTSRSLNDPVLLTQVQSFLQEHRYAAIYFNNGLHGFHLERPQYAAALKVLTQFLIDHGNGAKLIFATSTPLSDMTEGHPLAKNNAIVLERNAAAAELMPGFGIPVDDLYALMVAHLDLHSDTYHFTHDGSVLLGNQVAQTLLTALAP